LELTAWYTFLAIAILVVAVLGRFVIYEILVGQSNCLPEKAGKIANAASGLVVAIGFISILVNFVGSRH
jgi:hypothetical protein